MILPGHIAAPLLASRFVDIDRRIAVLAGLAPDLADKFIFYVLHASNWTRVPAHSVSALVASSLAVALAGRLWRRDWRWGRAWVIGYGLHFLCDIMPGEGVLPWLWPFETYSHMVSPSRPWFLGGGPVPWLTLTAEVLLVAAAVVSEVMQRRQHRRPAQERHA